MAVVVKMEIGSYGGVCHVTRVQSFRTGGARMAVVVTMVLAVIVGVAAIAASFHRSD